MAHYIPFPFYSELWVFTYMDAVLVLQLPCVDFVSQARARYTVFSCCRYILILGSSKEKMFSKSLNFDSPFPLVFVVV